MDVFKKSLKVLEELFARDYQFALATSKDNIPSVRFIDTYYFEGAFYLVTYAQAQKAIEIEENCNVSMCNKLYRFNGVAHNIGHPLEEKNSRIREQLIKAFAPWYLAYNTENDPNMRYVKIQLKHGFFYKDGTGYKVDFEAKQSEEFPFEFEVVMID